MQWLIDKLLGIDRVALGQGEWSLIWRNPPAVWFLILVLIPAVLVGTYLVYRKEAESASRGMKVFLTLLRCLLIFLILVVLFQPVLLVEKQLEPKSTLIFLVDESLSMSFKDKFPDPQHHLKLGQLVGIYRPASPAYRTGRPSGRPEEKPSLSKDRMLDEMTRIDLVNKIFTNTNLDLLGHLKNKYKIKTYAFSSHIRGDVGLSELKAVGKATAIGNALQGAINDLAGQLITGVVVISDGQNNVGIDPVDAVSVLLRRGRTVPVYAIAAGNPQEPKDIELLELRAPEVAIAQDFVSFDFSLKSTGFENELVRIILREGDKVVAEKQVTLLGLNRKQSVALQYQPWQPGEYRCRVEVPFQSGELIKENNILPHYLKVVDEKIKILYIANYPRWEYRRLRDALIRDHTMKVACWLIQADPGFPQESSPDVPPLEVLPIDKKSLFNYDVIIFGDVDPRRLADPDVCGSLDADPVKLMEHIVTFVEETGGGIAFICGTKNNPRAFRHTPLMDLLPVLLEDEDYRLVRWDETITEAFTLKLTPEGKEDAIMRLIPDDPLANIKLWEDPQEGLPGLLWYYQVRRAKPAARVLTIHPFNKNKYGHHPIFVTQYYGGGRVFASLTDETWRWRFGVGDKYFYNFWGEVIRYLRGGKLVGSRRYNIYVDKPKYFLGEPVKISARIYDKEFEPLEADSFLSHLEMPNLLKKDLELAPHPKKPGHYTGQFTPTEMGNYRVWIGPEGIGQEKARTFASFVVALPMREYENPMVNRQILEALASKTGGAFLPIYEIDQLPHRIKPIGEVVYTEAQESDLWDSPLFFLIFLLVITSEWVIRKLVRLV